MSAGRALTVRTIALAVVAVLAAPQASAQVVVIGTNPQGSNYYAAGVAIAKLGQERLGQQFRVQPSGGSTGYIPLVDRGELDFGITSVQEMEFSYRGVDTFEGKPNAELRLVGAIFPLIVGLGVAADSAVKRVADLKGMRIPSDFPAQTVTIYNQDAMLATGGLATAQLERVPIPNQVKGVEALGEGRVDVAVAVAVAVVSLSQGVTREAHVKLASRGGVRVLSLDDSPQAIAALRKVLRRGYVQTLMPSPALVGVLAPTKTLYLSAFLFTHANASDDLNYGLAKAMHANKPELAAAAPALTQFDPAFMAEAHEVPYHRGAEKFYREVGQWPPRER